MPVVPTAMVGFREACPVITDKFVDYGPNMPIIMLPPLPLKLKIEFGVPFELEGYYGSSLLKEEEYRVANKIVRPKVAEVMAKHRRVDIPKIEIKMSTPQNS